MKWVVDTCVVLDVYMHDAEHGRVSADLLQKLLPEGLVVSPVTMVELAAEFSGNIGRQTQFLEQMGISHLENWTAADTASAHGAWSSWVMARREHRVPRRPVGDVLIGGFAANRRGLITRNAHDFRRWFPELTIREP